MWILNGYCVKYIFYFYMCNMFLFASKLYFLFELYHTGGVWVSLYSSYIIMCLEFSLLKFSLSQVVGTLLTSFMMTISELVELTESWSSSCFDKCVSVRRLKSALDLKLLLHHDQFVEQLVDAVNRKALRSRCVVGRRVLH